jgi:hypothetical protein
MDKPIHLCQRVDAIAPGGFFLSPPLQTAASCLRLSPPLPAGAKLAGLFEVTR